MVFLSPRCRFALFTLFNPLHVLQRRDNGAANHKRLLQEQLGRGGGGDGSGGLPISAKAALAPHRPPPGAPQT